MVYGGFRTLGGSGKADPGSGTLGVLSVHGCGKIYGRTGFGFSHCILDRTVPCL